VIKIKFFKILFKLKVYEIIIFNTVNVNVRIQEVKSFFIFAFLLITKLY